MAVKKKAKAAKSIAKTKIARARAKGAKKAKSAAQGLLEKYVILRKTVADAGDPFGAVAAEIAALPRGFEELRPIEVHVADMKVHEISDVRRDPQVLTIAPSMPIHLVEPVAIDTVAAPANGGIAWGVEAVRANQSLLSGAGVTVAVLDTGIDASHPAFAGVNLVQKDFTGEGVADRHGHGTHCAGTILGRDVDGLRIGVARGVDRALIGKVLGAQGGSTESIASAINWAVEEGANVISMSLGIDFPGLQERLQNAGFPPKLATSRALEGYRANVRLFDTLAAQVRARGLMGKGVVIVAAAGNESRRDVDPNFEITVAPPATADGIVSVGAVGQRGDSFDVASFSNAGANVVGPGVGVISARRGGGLVSMNGTSMATPHVAGVAALWAEQLMSFSGGRLIGDQLIAKVVGTAQRLSGISPMNAGAGLVNSP